MDTLTAILRRRDLLTTEQLDELSLRAQGSPRTLARLIAEDRLLSEASLAEVLAEQAGVPYRGLEDYRVDFDAFPTIPVDWMRQHGFVPLDDRDRVLTIAVSDPTDLKTLDLLERLLGRDLSLCVAPPSAIADALKESERNSHVVARITEEFRPVLIHENEQGEEVLSQETIPQDQSPIVRLVDTIVKNALQKRASDIHIEPADGVTEVKYRIDGVLYLAMEPLDLRFHNPLVSRIKVMSELDIAERRVPQDGRFKLRIEQRTIDFRVSIIPSVYGESVVIRILAKEEFTAANKGLHLDSLGLKPEDLARFRRAITASYGMVLVTGPTGSGKTTTLYAALNEVNTKEDKVLTIEDPVEYQLKGVVQIPVNEKKGLTFAKGLRSILRHDPDKIMVGEIRDAETAQIAIQSALTGHLVFTTVHANNAFDVIGRFVNMGIEPYNFVASLNCIMAQRLVRKLCASCKVPITVSPDQCVQLGFDPTLFVGKVLYGDKGCVDCHGLGFRGRHAITEFLPVTDRIKDLILEKKPPSEIRQAALDAGMTSLREAGIAKILAGETTMKEVNRMTFLG
ncbi:MAG: type II/IV secretion system protein [Nitrospira sp.]|nr:type II/IV secretion system protein [Nitrospira sp.]MBS0167417.1 type II/IV secretion system protein [Nitrospira sp.]